MTFTPLAPFAHARLRHHPNPERVSAADYPAALRRHFDPAATAAAVTEISAWPGYQPTPLRVLEGLPGVDSGADSLALYYKDESGRFGLGSFKALGGAYAVLGVLQAALRERGLTATAAELEGGALSEATTAITVVTATDGNHGRAVAWGARRFGCACRIYIHAAVSAARATAMEALGAEVVRIRGDYDESVRCAAAEAAAHGWYVVADTAYPGYTEVPAQIMAGYGVMVEETLRQLPAAATHVFVQGGVGGLAAAVAACLWARLGERRPRVVVVEPEWAACLFASARAGRATAVPIETETVMAGLSCGEPSPLAWEVLRCAVDDFITIPDDLVAPAMRLLAHHTPPIEGGESAVAGFAACLAAWMDAPLRAALDLNADSRVLLIGTEGATDPEIYAAMVRDAPAA